MELSRYSRFSYAVCPSGHACFSKALTNIVYKHMPVAVLSIYYCCTARQMCTVFKQLCLTAYVCFHNLSTFCAGTVRYASNDILSALSGTGNSGQVQLERAAKHDLVALVKSLWAIQWERADELNQINASDTEVICKQYFLIV